MSRKKGYIVVLGRRAIRMDGKSEPFIFPSRKKALKHVEGNALDVVFAGSLKVYKVEETDSL